MAFDLNFDIRRNCHEIYDSLYRTNQKSLRHWTSRHDNALVQTYDLIEQWTHEGNIYIQDLRDNDQFMYDILHQWTTNHYQDIQNILRGGVRQFIWYEHPFFTLIIFLNNNVKLYIMPFLKDGIFINPLMQIKCMKPY